MHIISTILNRNREHQIERNGGWGYELKDVKASTLKAMLRDAQTICEDGHGYGHGYGHGGKVEFINASKNSGQGTAMSLINIEG